MFTVDFEKEDDRLHYIETPLDTSVVVPREPDCLHAKCPKCRGTGVNTETKQSCLHMISCRCPKCSPRC